MDDDPLIDDLDSTDTEPSADLFREVPWWTWGRATSPAKGAAEPADDLQMRSGDGDDSPDIATILRRALMDLSAALQEIERQLTSIPEDGYEDGYPEDGSAPTRG